MNNLDNCLARLLNVIKILQDNTDKIECNDNSCTKPFLGPNFTSICFNTRPVMLYRCDNTPVTLDYTNAAGEFLTTDVFRVQSVSNDSVGVLLLEEVINGDTIYNNTNTFATINLGCVCAIKCLGDTIVSNV